MYIHLHRYIYACLLIYTCGYIYICTGITPAEVYRQVLVYIHVHLYTHAQVYTHCISVQYIPVQLYTRVYQTCTHVCTKVYLHVGTGVQTCTCVHTCTGIYTCTGICTHAGVRLVYRYTYLYRYTCIHTCTGIHTCKDIYTHTHNIYGGINKMTQIYVHENLLRWRCLTASASSLFSNAEVMLGGASFSCGRCSSPNIAL